MRDRGRTIGAITLAVLILFMAYYLTWAQDTGSYDPNTEVILSGVITTPMLSQRGPRIFIFLSGEKSYHVITGPWWYLRQLRLELREGMKVEVRGSKFYSRDGELTIVIYSLKDFDTGKTYQFRTEDLVPLWHGMMHGR